MDGGRGGGQPRVMDEPKTALLFPGQGSQSEEMRGAVERHRPELLEVVEREVGVDPFPRVGEGTRFAQPAIFCASIAGFSALVDREATAVAGHSLGELGALVAAEALSVEDGVRLVALRGRLMQESGERASRSGDGMLAVRTDLEGATALAEGHGLSLANDNAPGQIVLSGPGEALEAAAHAARSQGLPATRLPVTGAFHSPAMAGAVPEYEGALAQTDFATPRVDVFSGVTARPFDDVGRRLAESLTHPVRWRELLLELEARGVRRFVETGPGRVLTGLVRRTLDGVEAVSASDRPEAARA